MRLSGLIILFYFCTSLICSSQNRVDSVSLESYLQEVESNSNFSFFYQKEWIDSFKISAQTEVESFTPSMLDSIFTKSPLNYYVADQNIYLLNNQRILTELSLLQQKASAAEIVELEPQFAESNEPITDLEKVLFRVGSIKEYGKTNENVIKGIIRSTEGEPVGDAFVYSSKTYALTSEDGRYEIVLPSGKNELQFQKVGMVDTKRSLFVYSSGNFDVEMQPDIQVLETIEVLASRERTIQSAEIGLLKLSKKDVKIVPALLGEKDVIRVATLSAGIQNVGEGAAGINVRGGKADQNLFLLDNATIFNTNHFFGFFTILHPDGVSDMELFKSGIPARLGGRLSSVFDIKSRAPETDKFHMNGGVGPVVSKIMMDIPLVKDKAGILLGGRATYSDFVLDQIEDSPLANNDVAFYDLIFKANYQLDKNNELSTTFYYSKDRFKITSDTLLSFTDFSYSNRLLSASWKHVFSDYLKAEFQVGNSLYEYGSSYDLIPSQAFGVDFSVMESNVSASFDYYRNERLNYFFGADVKLHEVNPGTRFSIGDESLILDEQVQRERGLEFNPYVSAEYQLTEKLLLDAGLRYNIFSAFGPASVNQYAAGTPISESSIVGTESFDSNDIIKTYHGVEFRVSSRFLLNNNSSIKAAYNRTRQNHHLLINAVSIAPTDVWRLSGPFIKPQIADQISVGYFKNIFGRDFFEISGELYYKRIQNLLDFRTGAELQFNNAIETDLLQGDGKSYGFELTVKKPDGWLNGWINYTYSRSLIRLDSDSPENRVNGGSFFPTGYDKPHYVNAVINYKFTSRLTFTASSVFASGIPVTYPEGKWFYKGSENILFSDRNEFRIPNYFRLDFGVNVDASHKLKKWTHSSWTFSVYNVLGRDNVYSIFFTVEDGEIRGYKTTVFEDPIPTITYNFRF